MSDQPDERSVRRAKTARSFITLAVAAAWTIMPEDLLVAATLPVEWAGRLKWTVHGAATVITPDAAREWVRKGVEKGAVVALEDLLVAAELSPVWAGRLKVGAIDHR